MPFNNTQHCAHTTYILPNFSILISKVIIFNFNMVVGDNNRKKGKLFGAVGLGHSNSLSTFAQI